jgi:cob(I)alamin adenosyltransferase
MEDIHRTALCQQSPTYTDPSTGFLVFTEIAHLQRGHCCGNQCRHCPYGWVHCRTGVRRPATVASGDAAAVQGRLAEIEELGVAWQQQQPAATASDKANANATNDSPRKKKQTGGRHGGRLTDKNVPYTRGGDKGTSQLLTGERRSKADDAFEAMGTVDELCSFVGVVHAQLLQDARSGESLSTSESSVTTEIDLANQLLEIMSRLFDIGSHVAKPAKLPDDDSDTDDSSEPKKSRFVADGIGGGFDLLHVEELEDWIDTLTEDLPELRSFLLPTGTLAAAHLHTARCVCRRAERCLVPLVQDGVCDPTALQYVNRLSDYLFSAARWVNVKGHQAEIQYQRPHQGAKQRRRVQLEHQEES